MTQVDTSGLVKAIQIRVKPDIHQWLKEQGRQKDRSVNYVINQVLASVRAQESQQQVEGAQA